MPGLKADGVQFALLRQAVEATGHAIDVAFAESAVAVRITVPQPALSDTESS